jgi:hypothetical protein
VSSLRVGEGAVWFGSRGGRRVQGLRRVGEGHDFGVDDDELVRWEYVGDIIRVIAKSEENEGVF